MKTMRFLYRPKLEERDPEGNFHGTIFSVVFGNFRYEMLNSLGIGAQWFRERGMALVGLEHRFRFAKAPVGKEEDSVVFELFLTKIENEGRGKGDIHFACRAYRGSDMALAGEGSAISVVITKDPRGRAPVPDEALEKLAPYLHPQEA